MHKLTREQEAAAILTIRKGGHDGEKAKAMFMYFNQPLVGFVARRYRDKGLTWVELLYAGNIGLLQALNRFDISKGTWFATFAVPWIAGEIKQRFAATKKERLSDKAVMATEFGVPLVDERGAPLVDDVFEEAKEGNALSPVEQACSDGIGSIAGCAEFGDSLRGEDTVGDPIPSRGLTINFAPDCSTGVMSVDTNLIPAIEQAIERLKDNRQATVIAMRLGLRGHKQHIFREIGQALGVTSQRAHDIYEEALKHLYEDPTLQLLFEQTI